MRKLFFILSFAALGLTAVGAGAAGAQNGPASADRSAQPAGTMAATLPAIDHALGNARATTSGNTLTVTTGAVRQQWTLVPTGLATTSLKNTATGKEWCTPGNTVRDWGFYGLLDGKQAKLVSLTADTDNDEGFADDHVRILAEFEYPAAETSVRYEIWAYPDANGIMTRLWFKGQVNSHFTKPAPEKNDIVVVRAIGAKPYYTPFAFQTPQPEWFNSVGRDEKQPLNLGLDNLDPKKEYKIGVSFFNNVNDQTITEDVKLVCNKLTTMVIDNVVIEPYGKARAGASGHSAQPAKAGAAEPQTIFFDIPAGTLSAGDATLVISNKKAGEISMASEVIVYEKSDKPSIREIMSTVPARMPQLVAAAPTDYRLVGYGNLGSRTGNAPTPPNGYLARLPIAADGAQRLYGGYFADTQNRDLRETPLLREDIYTGPIDGVERVGWASFVALSSGNDGLVVLKESHKCVNSYGCDTGDFTLDANSLTNTGLGLEVGDVVPDKYTMGWANWTILCSASAPAGCAERLVGSGRMGERSASACEPSEASSPTGAGLSRVAWCRSAEGGNSAQAAGQGEKSVPPTGLAASATPATLAAAGYGADGIDIALAVKKFDRVRFPLAGPLKLMSNTWGTNTKNPRYQASEENVLLEIASGADLGVDVVQIDDGWQGMTYKNWRPAASFDPEGKLPIYPEGWKNVRAAAAKAGLQLGLWSAPEMCPLDALVSNFDEGDFRFYKFDFEHMTDRASIDSITGKARQLILHSGHKTSINWDLTEIVPRVGVYSSREYGNLFLENRRPGTPINTTYIPYLVLRDAWHISKYVNLNKIQIDIQNLSTIPEKLSNAQQYNQGYATAIALMSSPLFFCETHYFDEVARRQMRPLIAAWQREKGDLARGYVDPIGNEPDDASWTGFQNHLEGTNNGYLMIFRELNNKQTSQRIALKYCAGRRLRLTDLLTGRSSEATADAGGRVAFTIDNAPDYRFYKYTIL